MTLRQAHVEPENEEAVPAEPIRAAPAARTAVVDETVIDLRHLAAALWRGKWVILAFALAGAALGVMKLNEHTPAYKARMVVSPALTTDPTMLGGGASLRGGQLGALAGLAGLAAGGGAQATTFDRMKEVFKSFELAQTMDRKYGLFMRIFGAGWDARTQSWIRPEGWRFELDQKINAFLRQPTWAPPNMESLASYLGGAIQITELKATPFMEISVQHRDPEFALELLKTAYAEADQLLREQDRRQVNQRRSYIEERLSRTSLSDMRQVLLMLMAQEERSAMLLESDLPYAARIIEPPYVSSRPVVLRPAVEIGVRVLAGLAFAIALVAGWAVLRGRV
jgi:hypothetical protein